MPLMQGRDINKVSIQTVTLDSFCREAAVRPNVVKIDVEGAELLVLRGSEELLTESQPTLILAVHPYWLPTGQAPAQVAALLDAYGYTVFDSKGQPAGSLRSGEYLCLNSKGRFTAVQQHVDMIGVS